MRFRFRRSFITRVVGNKNWKFKKENFMANAQLNDLLRFDPDWFTDPVPPWVLQVLDKAVLRDLAVISLEHRRAAADLNNRALDQAISVLKKAKV
jgi:hypothetical protein